MCGRPRAQEAARMTDTQQGPRGSAEPPVSGRAAGGLASAACILSIVVTALDVRVMLLTRPNLIRG
jgi:hypothetical protein